MRRALHTPVTAGLLRVAVVALAAGISLGSNDALAQDAVVGATLQLDRPTPAMLGVQLLLDGDDDRDATATLRYRVAGSDAPWREAAPMWRVDPSTVTGLSVPEQLAGSIFELPADTAFELEVELVDPDGGDQTATATASTRPVPRAEPAQPRLVSVTDADGLRAALAAAAPGDVIELAAGTYPGSFSISASGTATDPIVIRGVERDTVVLDGQGCTGCNVLEVYGSHVHVERLTVRAAVRAIRFLGTGTEANVVRRVRIEDVVHGIGSGTDQRDFYLCDNVVDGRLQWPLVSSDDGAAHNDDQGIRVSGDGHVVCHNHIRGFGDPLLNFTDGYRANDFYGNEIVEIYGDGVELDRAQGNVALRRNRFTNVYTAISIQPVHGGPVYVLRNVVSNVADEQIKLKSVGGTVEPSGALIAHNTFVSPELALNLQTPITQYHFLVTNNIFIGPATTTRGFTVDWTARIVDGHFDHNGYHPDGSFWFGKDADGTNQIWDSFAQVQTAGVYEANGRLLSPPFFAADPSLPTDYTVALDPLDPELADGSAALDAGQRIAGLNDDHTGAAPDLGAHEAGCSQPVYGPRPEGLDENTPFVACADDPVPPDDLGGDLDDTGADTSEPTDTATASDTRAPTDSETAGDTTTPGDTHTTSDSSVSADTDTDTLLADPGDGGGDDEGCGCRAVRGAAPASGGLVMWGVLCLLALLRARRRGA